MAGERVGASLPALSLDKGADSGYRATRKGTQGTHKAWTTGWGLGEGRRQDAFNLYSGLYISPCVLAWEKKK